MADAYDFWAERITSGEKAAIDRFWERFAHIAPDLDASFRGVREPVDVAHMVTEALGELADQISSWEFGPGETGGHHLALSPELNHVLRPLARAAISRAPTLEGWSFSDARPPTPLSENTVALIEGRAHLPFTLAGITPAAGEHQRIDFTGSGKGDTGTIAGLAGLSFSVLFGEAVERDWLGELDGGKRGLLSAFSRAPAPETWLPGFVDSTTDVLNSLMDARPASPRASVYSDDSDFSLFKAEPHSDTGSPRADLFSCFSCHPDLAQARFAGVRISSARFSRFGESLCGVRIPRTPDHPFDQVDDRADLAQVIHDALAVDQTGGVTGEGHGKEHVYIDFATTDIAAAMARVEAELGGAGITAPCHLLFDDAGLEDRMLPLTSAARRH